MYNHHNGVVLEKVSESDLPFLLAVKNQSWGFTHTTVIANEKDQLSWFDGLNPHTDLALKAVIGSEIVGFSLMSHIDWVSRKLSLSGSLNKDILIKRDNSWANVAKPCFEAGLDFCFEVLNMNRVEAEVLEHNTPAQKLEIDHLGFKIEGRKRESVFKSGVYYDSIVLGMLFSDWITNKRVVDHQTKSKSCNRNVDNIKSFKSVKTSRSHYFNESIQARSFFP